MKVAVIGGGDSYEAEVSRSSAAEVCAALEENHEVRYVELDSALTASLLEFNADVVFPVLHGPPGEDGTVQGYLEILGYPYVGSGVTASASGMNKFIAKTMFREANLHVPETVVVRHDDVTSRIVEIERRFSKGVVVKPNFQGSALGVTLLPNPSIGDIESAIQHGLEFGNSVLVEPFVEGREITVGVLDLHGAAVMALPIIEIEVKENEWYDFENRYTPGNSKHKMFEETAKASTCELLSRTAVEAHRALGCRDLSRADFVLDDTDQPWLLEVNTMPGMTPTSLYPDAAAAIDIRFSELVSHLVESAFARQQASAEPST